jgi:predicted DNA-binding protein (MmcQ/YjbR family)
MNIEEIRDYCLAKSAVTGGFPFDETTLVFKVMNKRFALTGLEGDPPYVNLKCDPERTIEIRGQYEDIQPGWHMNKAIIE